MDGKTIKERAEQVSQTEGVEQDRQALHREESGGETAKAWPEPEPPSESFLRIKALKERINRLTSGSRRLPHALFWMAFSSEVERIKRKKLAERRRRALLLGTDET